MGREQRVGRVLGPKRLLKVIADAGKDSQRHQLVWIFCRRCAFLGVVRWNDLIRGESLSKKGKKRKANETCGCDAVDWHEKIKKEKAQRVPAQLRLVIWAAAQWRATFPAIRRRFADALRIHRIDRFTFSAVVRGMDADLQGMEVAAEIDEWGRIACEMDAIENPKGSAYPWRYPGQFLPEEMRIRRGGFGGSWAGRIEKAERVLEDWGFMEECADPEVLNALRKRGFHVRDCVFTARRVMNAVAYTKSQRRQRKQEKATQVVMEAEAERFLNNQDYLTIDAG